ncbi:hypothetical protein HY212_02820 [Candidatus Pacearchaeota archaeon]|nr:hypothetical protein [Candidatus Pacearchaeota archaeon]
MESLGDYFKKVEARTPELDRALEEAKEKRMKSLKEHLNGPTVSDLFNSGSSVPPEHLVFDSRTGTTYVNPTYEILHWKSPRRNN